MNPAAPMTATRRYPISAALFLSVEHGRSPPARRGTAPAPGESRLTLPGTGTNHKALKALPAQVAELVDAQVSGTCGRKLVEVRVFSWAPPKWGIIEQASVSIHLHRGDLPPDIDFTGVVAIDTETMGLNPHRDRLCLVQLSAGDGVCHLVQLAPGQYEAPRLRALLVDPTVLKLFHFGRFDIAVLPHHLGVLAGPVYCTKIASKLVGTFTDRHGLKDLRRDLLGVDLSKQQQSSAGGAAELSDEQLRYAASDVLHLHALRAKLDVMLAREGRSAIAAACFEFLPTRALLDLAGWPEEDIFAH